MKKQIKLYSSIIFVAFATVLLLSIPLVAMQFTNDVNWSAIDFFIMGTLIFSIGLTYVLLSRQAPGILYRIALVVCLGITLLMIWVNLAVGLIAGGPNAGNLMYGTVVLVIIFSAASSRFKPSGMERAMYATAIALGLLTTIALLAGMQHYPGSSVGEILGVGGFFAGVYLITGVLFRYSTRECRSNK